MSEQDQERAGLLLNSAREAARRMPNVAGEFGEECAGIMDALLARLARAEQERDEHIARGDRLIAKLGVERQWQDSLRAERDAARAECARLREAVRAFLKAHDHEYAEWHIPYSTDRPLETYRTLAALRAALAGPGEQGGSDG